MRQLSSLRLVTFVSLLAAISVSPAVACLWDRDTLAMEAKGLPGVVEVITGRFFRPPPKFYEMRLERVEGEIGTDPTRLDLYDDAAVACDRLGRGDEALAWMERKRAAMDTAIAAGGDIGEHEYRYHANIGTFYIHRWLRDGADRGAMEDAELARDHIARAIEINPDAHFGRETYQLLAIEWVLDPPEAAGPLPSVFDAAEVDGVRVQPRGSSRIGGIDEYYGITNPVEGLSGLIVLGNAWESFDIYYALGIALNAENAATLSELTKLRCQELLDAGRGSLYPDAMTDGGAEFATEATEDGLRLLGLGVTRESEIASFYRRARQEAQDWNRAKSAYMLAKLRAGAHPDTDADFWAGFEESTAPALPGSATLFWEWNLGEFWRAQLAVGGLVLVLAGLVGLRVRKALKRRASPAENQ